MKSIPLLISGALLAAGCATMSDADIARQAATSCAPHSGERPGEARPPESGRPARRVQPRRRQAPAARGCRNASKMRKRPGQVPRRWQTSATGRAGERIAQSGVGKQFSDNRPACSGGQLLRLPPVEPAGSPSEPSVPQPGYGKAARQHRSHPALHLQQDLEFAGLERVFEHAALRSQRHPHRATGQDVTALLLDPQSPVNSEPGAAPVGAVPAREY